MPLSCRRVAAAAAAVLRKAGPAREKLVRRPSVVVRQLLSATRGFIHADNSSGFGMDAEAMASVPRLQLHKPLQFGS
jgi:hypothetical protein